MHFDDDEERQMTKKPSNMILNVVIAVAAVFGLFVLGSWSL